MTSVKGMFSGAAIVSNTSFSRRDEFNHSQNRLTVYLTQGLFAKETVHVTMSQHFPIDCHSLVEITGTMLAWRRSPFSLAWSFGASNKLSRSAARGSQGYLLSAQTGKPGPIFLNQVAGAS